MDIICNICNSYATDKNKFIYNHIKEMSPIAMNPHQSNPKHPNKTKTSEKNTNFLLHPIVLKKHPTGTCKSISDTSFDLHFPPLHKRRWKMSPNLNKHFKCRSESEYKCQLLYIHPLPFLEGYTVPPEFWNGSCRFSRSFLIANGTGKYRSGQIFEKTQPSLLTLCPLKAFDTPTMCAIRSENGVNCNLEGLACRHFVCGSVILKGIVPVMVCIELRGIFWKQLSIYMKALVNYFSFLNGKCV